MVPESAGGKVSPTGVFGWWLLYVAFVIYGSFVPLEFHALSPAVAWDKFLSIHLLDVGTQGRGDWVSNGVLYIPVGFLTFNLLAGQRTGYRCLPYLVAALGFSFLLATSVEFLQLYFPKRTVSLNDLTAEWIGSVLGVTLAHQSRDRFWTLLSAWRKIHFDQLITYVLEFFVFLYLAFSFFPFDFTLSAQEVEWKLLSDSWGWFVAKDFHSGSAVISIVKLAAEVLATLPLGILLARLIPNASRTHALAIGIGVGVAIEIGQLFLISGLSQGVSILTRGCGVLLGGIIWQGRERFGIDWAQNVLRQHFWWFLLTYVLAVATINGWFRLPWGNLASAGQVFDETRFVLFYYHYYTTEQAALVSLVSIALMYTPVGILAWGRHKPAAAAGLVAAFLATFFETSKLFLNGLHPDPSNVLIASLAAWIVAKALVFSEYESGHPNTDKPPPKSVEATNESDVSRFGVLRDRFLRLNANEVETLHQPGRLVLSLSAIGLIPVVWTVAGFPGINLGLAILLLANGAMLWFRPHLMLMTLPAAAVILDLAPWTGRFMIDEFDLLVATSLAIGYLRTKRRRSNAKIDLVFWLTAAGLAISYIVSTLIGLYPWKPIDSNSFNHYHSQFNALRLAKGALWAFLLIGLISRFAASGKPVFKNLSFGMAMGAAGVVLTVLWERIAFPGLLNFSDVYRVTGPFSQMHTGGADLEAFVTLSVPFLVYLLFEQRSLYWRLGLVLLLLGSAYSLMVSYARIGYAGYGIAFALAVSGMLTRKSSEPPGQKAWQIAAAALLCLLLAAIVGPVFFGKAAQERLSIAETDFKARQAHWQDALAMRDSGWLTTLFGTGLGRFPETHFWNSSEPRAGSYLLLQEANGNKFLRLGKGQPLYVEQMVSVVPGEKFMLQALLRSKKKGSQITVVICEKWLLTSGDCIQKSIDFGGSGEWAAFNYEWQADEIGGEKRTLKFSIFNTSKDAIIDVDQLSLYDENNINRLANGHFSSQMDHWFFSVDDDLPWHIWSLPMHLIFESGWFGLLAFGVILLYGMKRSGEEAFQGNGKAATLLAALAGLTVIGSMDSLIDSPRILLLLLTVVLLSLKLNQWDGRPLPSRS